MRIVCFGDSNTYGYDPRSYFGSRYPEDVRWTGRLKDFDVINSGVNGMTVLRARSMFAERIRRMDPDMFIVMLGTNDLLTGTGAEQTAENMERFLDIVREKGSPVLLIAPPLLQLGDWVCDADEIEESQELAVLYRELAERDGLLFADAGAWGIDLTFDGVHFSPEGHAVFAGRLEEFLKQL